MAKANESIGEKLCRAAREGNLKAVEQLLTEIDFKRDGQALDRALVAANFFGAKKIDITDRLLKAGANPNQVTSVGTLLTCAAMNGDLPLVKRLIEAGADLNREVKRETALSAALSYNQRTVIVYLEKLGAKSPPSTTLLYASMYGDVERAKQAIAEGAELEKIGGTFEETPLMAAARKGQVEAVKLLLQHGANPNKLVKGSTALFDAVEHGKNIHVLDAMVAAGADVHLKECDETILMAAAKGGSLPIVKRLVELGADVLARDKNFGVTALDCAKQNKHKEIANYLSSLGATADRDAPRALAKALARKFGGKPVEHSTGFMLNARFHGTKCQFSIGTDGFSLFLRGLDFGEPNFKRSKDGQIIFAVAKPDFQRQKFEQVKGASCGVFVFRTLGLSPLAATVAAKFSAKHKEHIQQLNLVKGEILRLGGNFAGFYCPSIDLSLAEKRLENLAQLIKGVSRPPPPERSLFSGEWLLKPAPKSSASARHQFGGKLEQPVACPHCGGATNLMTQLDLSDPALPKSSLGRGKLPVFWCLDCLEWDAVFYDISSPAPKPFKLGGKAAEAGKIKAGEEDLPERRLTLVPVAAGKKAGRKSKIGGSPTWIQMEETPDCPKCEKPMAFVLQLASDSRISYGDMGMLYAFACPECSVAAFLIQSH